MDRIGSLSVLIRGDLSVFRDHGVVWCIMLISVVAGRVSYGDVLCGEAAASGS